MVLGSPAVNTFAAMHMLEGELPCLNLRAGTDDFAIKTCRLGERKVLLLQGGLGRAVLYAVYTYFEQNGCGWFWGGDYVPKLDKETLWAKDFDIVETMRFQYRGIRYFAHRGCKRFRAEEWDFDDWKREIDYLAKRRLNLFMLRIGQDDLFQRAFPNDVKYPTEETMDALTFPPYDKDSLIKGGYSDRRLFWSLEYRGELRKKVLAYAFDRGFMHPEDCGTMTHWNTLTPIDFIENKKPKFFNETYVGTNYGKYQTGQVWDIREDKEFEYYMQLTKAHIKEYGKAEIFHTIGFGERMFSEDRAKNFQMKRYVYDRYLQALKTEYPTCPVFIASWDLWLRYTSEEVQQLVASLDKTQSIIFDYTSDSPYTNNFTRWNVVGNFPYVFGIFHAYANFNDCLGFYSLTEERMQVAKADEYCKGIIYWPELSHSDTLMQEFFMGNARSDQVIGVNEALNTMCIRRYGEYAEQMQQIWEQALPVIQLMHWTMRADPEGNTEYYFFTLYRRYMPWIFKGESAEKFSDGMDVEKAKNALKNATECFRLLRALPSCVYENEFIRRDIADIARTLLGRYVNINLILEAQAIVEYQKTGEGKAAITNIIKTTTNMRLSLFFLIYRQIVSTLIRLEFPLLPLVVPPVMTITSFFFAKPLFKAVCLAK